MAIYAIGDVQGCYKALTCLLKQIQFDENADQLWFAGDLVNRGPDSLASLRLIKQLSEKGCAKVVLGNHDLHLLACYFSEQHRPRRKDTFKEILDAPDCDELMLWLKTQPLMVWDESRDMVMTHAGMPHIWSVKAAMAYAEEVKTKLQSESCADYFDEMYGNEPDVWSDCLQGQTRLRVITNYFTRMRFISLEGHLEFAAKESVSSAPSGYIPWFEFPRKDSTRFLFGHWAALEGATNRSHAIGLDTGCVWGNKLTAFNLDTQERFSCDCAVER